MTKEQRTTTKEQKEGNKKIVEFLGLKRVWWIHQEKPLTDDKKQWCDFDGKTFLGTRAYFDKDLMFHSSWEWFYQAWNKFREEVPFVIDKKGVCYYNSTLLCVMEAALYEGDINTAFKTLVALVDWYNSIDK